MAAPFPIRASSPADARVLAALERQCFSDPWSEPGVREMLASPQVIGLVCEAGEEVAGYAFARWAADTGEILNIATAPGFRRQGVARALLEEALARLQGQGVREVYLEVRESNLAARKLYQGRGFRVAGMRRAYYRSPSEDALVLTLPLDGAAF